jgi:hypothetical protein
MKSTAGLRLSATTEWIALKRRSVARLDASKFRVSSTGMNSVSVSDSFFTCTEF